MAVSPAPGLAPPNSEIVKAAKAKRFQEGAAPIGKLVAPTDGEVTNFTDPHPMADTKCADHSGDAFDDISKDIMDYSGPVGYEDEPQERSST